LKFSKLLLTASLSYSIKGKKKTHLSSWDDAVTYIVYHGQCILFFSQFTTTYRLHGRRHIQNGVVGQVGGGREGVHVTDRAHGGAVVVLVVDQRVEFLHHNRHKLTGLGRNGRVNRGRLEGLEKKREKT
jgi:hypothetical protein